LLKVLHLTPPILAGGNGLDIGLWSRRGIRVRDWLSGRKEAERWHLSISPSPIIAMVVLLMSPRARTSTPAFMLGWIASIATALALFSGSRNTTPP
jgi:hypothetical protein